MPLTCVTITGADDSIDPLELATLSSEYPFVEWGILFSGSQVGQARFPSGKWVQELLRVRTPQMRLSAHLCGKYVRHAMRGEQFAGPAGLVTLLPRFQRIQLNFHAFPHAPETGWRETLPPGARVIFQCDGVNDDWVRPLVAVNAGVPLFDSSGGAGRLPSVWPDPWADVLCGYAGGLGPDNVVAQVLQIETQTKSAPYWIDMERRVRSSDDLQFDLDKVRHVLRDIEPLVQMRPPIPQTPQQARNGQTRIAKPSV